MTKGIHNGLGQIQRLVLFHLAYGELDTVTLTAKVFGVSPKPDPNGAWDMTFAQHSAVRRALKTLQRAGKVGISGHKQRCTLWMTMERLARLMAMDSTCAICQAKLRDQDLIYSLSSGDDVHVQCHDGQPTPALRNSYRYENEYRKLNGMSNAAAPLQTNPST
jgi:hypothetical protein